MSIHVAILDESGTILDVNPAWEQFARINTGQTKQATTGSNYLAVCDASARNGNGDANVVANGIRNLFNSPGAQEFALEYDCDSTEGERWYKVKGWRLDWEQRRYAIISHNDVTQSVLQRKALEIASLTDGLTGISNRRHFDRFLSHEWRRDMRRGTPLSLIMVDVDHFKLLNDRYGHPSGDDCLKHIAKLINTMAQRPGDLAVRFGGEEFCLILGTTPEKAAYRFAESIRAGVEHLQISNEDSEVSDRVTVSVGVATMIPSRGSNEILLLERADEALYQAKNSGRNTVVIKS